MTLLVKQVLTGQAKQIITMLAQQFNNIQLEYQIPKLVKQVMFQLDKQVITELAMQAMTLVEWLLVKY